MAASSLGAPQAAAPQHHFQVTRQSRPQLTNQGLAGCVPANQREAELVNPCAASARSVIQLRYFKDRDFGPGQDDTCYVHSIKINIIVGILK